MTEDERVFVASIPKAIWWKRLPLIRHIRAVWAKWQVDAHYEAWAMMGLLPVNSGFDYAVIEAIWRGEV